MTNKTIFTLPEIVRDDQLTAHEYVYARLRNGLMVGTIAPGTPLKIRALADYLGISPTPVREALRRLCSETALEVLSNRRIIVPQMTIARFEELILLRVRLECLAAERALPYVSDILIERMATIDTRMDAAIREHKHDALTVLNQTFHKLLYTAYPDQVAMPLIESIWLQLGPFQRQVIDRVMRYYLVDRHKEILDALKARNAIDLCVATEADIRDGIGRAGREVMKEKSE